LIDLLNNNTNLCFTITVCKKKIMTTEKKTKLFNYDRDSQLRVKSQF